MISAREAGASEGALAAPLEAMPRASGGRGPERRGLRRAVRVAVALALIAAITVVLARLIPVNATTAGLVYLVAILLIATKVGLFESTVASAAALLCFNFFFLPPIGKWTISGPQNWVAFFAFLATALTASQLSARARRRALEAEERSSELERLYTLSRALLLVGVSRSHLKQMVQEIARVVGIPGVALYVRATGELYRDHLDEPGLEGMLRESAMRSTVVRVQDRELLISPIRLGGKPIASLALKAGALSDAALQSLLNLVAIALERENAYRAMTRAEVARHSEELKSTLLDSLAHEFKSPLTSIKAATTDLLSAEPDTLEPHQRELISIVDESTDWLGRLVSDAIQLARIEGGSFKLDLEVHSVASMVDIAIRQMKSRIVDRGIEVAIPDDLPPVRVDAGLIQVVLTHLLDNALKYSPAGAPIKISAHVGEGEVIVGVADRGEGISAEEQARIFDKFYRGRKEQHLQGTGMGLAIVREILRAHGEDIAVTSSPGQGAEFSFALPLARRGRRR